MSIDFMFGLLIACFVCMFFLIIGMVLGVILVTNAKMSKFIDKKYKLRKGKKFNTKSPKQTNKVSK